MEALIGEGHESQCSRAVGAEERDQGESPAGGRWPLRSPLFSTLLKMAMVDVRGDDVNSWLQARAAQAGIKHGSPGSSGRRFHPRQILSGVRKAMAPLTPTTRTVRSLPLAKFARHECSVCVELLADTQAICSCLDIM